MMKLVKFILVAAALFSAGTAGAGRKVNPSSVSVDTTSRVAQGAVGSARNSADNMQYIGCNVTVQANGQAIACCATNPANVSACCSSTNANFIAVAQTVSGDSYLYFTWDATNTCTYLQVSNGSAYAPKQP